VRALRAPAEDCRPPTSQGHPSHTREVRAKARFRAVWRRQRQSSSSWKQQRQQFPRGRASEAPRVQSWWHCAAYLRDSKIRGKTKRPKQAELDRFRVSLGVTHHLGRFKLSQCPFPHRALPSALGLMSLWKKTALFLPSQSVYLWLPFLIPLARTSSTLPKSSCERGQSAFFLILSGKLLSFSPLWC
jgi:hypothetical protein